MKGVPQSVVAAAAAEGFSHATPLALDALLKHCQLAERGSYDCLLSRGEVSGRRDRTRCILYGTGYKFVRQLLAVSDPQIGCAQLILGLRGEEGGGGEVQGETVVGEDSVKREA